MNLQYFGKYKSTLERNIKNLKQMYFHHDDFRGNVKEECETKFSMQHFFSKHSNTLSKNFQGHDLRPTISAISIVLSI